MGLRDSNLKRLAEQEFDVLVIGGGINGAVSAASLAARGVKVALVDRGDFAGETSSNSSNLAWGGIKYLESHEYLLVNKLCQSRNHLMRSYPSTVKEIRFFTTIQNGFRFWSFFVFLGALFYWFIGRCFTQMPRYITARGLERGEPVINTGNVAGGLEYSDCYLYDNDARFVYNFVRKSMDFGCVAANYVEVSDLRRERGLWMATAHDTEGDQKMTLRARVLINAAGPWVDQLNSLSGERTDYRHLFSKGVHLVVDQITDNRRVLTFFASDGRLFFLIPMGPKTCIGTTDTQVDDPKVGVTDEDRDFIIANANALLDLNPPLTRDDIIAERCGVRPLAVAGDDGGEADWIKLSRKHEIESNCQDRHISIFGGKLTDCLNVGDEVACAVKALGVSMPFFNERWYGEAPRSLRKAFMHQAALMELDAMTDPSSSEPLSERFWRRYGEKAFELLERIREDVSSVDLLIQNAEYTRCEIELTARLEMITRLDDFLRRRSKIEQVVRRDEIINAPGLREACEIFFPGRADEKLMEYIDSTTARI